MKKYAVSVLLFIPVLIIITGCGLTETKAVKEQAMNTKQVKIDTGLIVGMVTGEKGKEVNVYRGIPYAAPPVGELRWKAPQPPAKWEGVRDCTQYSKMPIQNMTLGIPGSPAADCSEDCLYLNVQVPANAKGKLPVMVWFHGGMYAMGSGNDPLANNYRLPQQGVILVTTNHRLDVVGLIAHPLLSKESPKHVSGNYMFLDMIASLRWVQRNIAAFGGDPSNVTIFGESGGGSKVSTLMISPLAKGLFHRAICESGTAIAKGWWEGHPLTEMEALGVKIFDKLGIKTLEEARATPLEKFYRANAEVSKESGVLWGIVNAAVDGWVLTDIPINLYRQGKINAVPTICVANSGELISMFPMLVPAYVEMFNGLAKNGVKSYACIFNQVPAAWRTEGMADAPHGLELLYVFGDYDNKTGWWDFTFQMSSNMSGVPLKSRDPRLDATDKYVSESIMRMWAQFATTGDPNVKDLVQWPAYAKDKDQYMYIDKTLAVKSGFSKVGQK